jgi:hypothetical protein
MYFTYEKYINHLSSKNIQHIYKLLYLLFLSLLFEKVYIKNIYFVMYHDDNNDLFFFILCICCMFFDER